MRRSEVNLPYAQIYIFSLCLNQIERLIHLFNCSCEMLRKLHFLYRVHDLNVFFLVNKGTSTKSE